MRWHCSHVTLAVLFGYLYLSRWVHLYLNGHQNGNQHYDETVYGRVQAELPRVFGTVQSIAIVGLTQDV